MKRLSLYLAVLWLGYSSVVVAGDIVLRAAVTPEEAWIGQRVVLQIDVLGDSGWSQITRFGDIEITGAYLIHTGSQGARLQETIDGVSYSGQSYSLSIYPQAAGVIEVPAIPVEVTTQVWGSETTGNVQQASVPAVTILSKIPPGAEDIRGLVSTNLLTAEQKWEPSIETVKVGDALKRIVTLQADDVSAMAFAPLQYEDIPGVGIYPAEPVVNDTANRGSLSGTRIETVTYVFERPGEVRLPDIRMAWWDIGAGELKRIELPGQLLQVAAGPAAESGALARTGNRQMTLYSWSVLVVLLLALVLAVHFRDGIKHRWRAWWKARSESETRYFRRAIRSLGTGDARDGIRDTMRWLDRINDNNCPARLDLFLRQYGDTPVQEAADWLARNVASGKKIAKVSALLSGLPAARDRWRQALHTRRRGPERLPGLNQG